MLFLYWGQFFFIGDYNESRENYEKQIENSL